ncbi:MAG: glycosyltransferase [Pseudomonadales bacterium]|nr:glycosyltransferase [Pseudomonadales bacterium]
MKNENIVFFSSDDWGWKTSKYQLSTRLSKENKLLFVSSIGFRAPRASAEDVGRIFKKIGKFFNGLEKVSENLYVLTPLVVPFSWLPFKNLFNRIFLRLQVNRAMWKMGMQTPYVFVFSQNWYEHIKSLSRKKLIYYCVDEQGGFSGLDGQSFNDLDKKMNSAADIIMCSARSLYEKNVVSNKNTFYMPHGVNYDLFASTMNDDVKVANDISVIKKPVFLFFGHISYDWVDADLVKYLAKQKPEWSWVYVGRYSMDEQEFCGFNNIYLLGEKDFEDLPSYCKGADVAIIPFVYSDLTNNCNPLKLPEYLAAGLPVVSTNIPEVKLSYSEGVYIGSSNDGFLAECEKALIEVDKARAMRLSDSMAQHSWDQRVQDIFQIMQR